MSNCPICQTPYTEGEITSCPTCGWDLNPLPMIVGEIPEAFVAQEKAKLEWAQQLWSQWEKASQVSTEELEALRQQNQELSHFLQERELQNKTLQQEEKTLQDKSNQAQQASQQLKQEKEALDRKNQESTQSLQEQQARMEILQEDFQDALDQLESKEEKEKLARFFFNRGIARDKQGDLEGAITNYTEAIRLNPNDATTYNIRGNAYYKQEDLEGAITDYTEAIRLNPNNATAYNKRGNAHYKQEDLEGAIADYKEVLRVDPDHTSAKNDLEKAQSWRSRN